MKKNGLKLVKGFAAAACMAVGVLSLNASAGLVSGAVSCTASTTTTSLIFNPSYEGCLGSYVGNIDNQLGDIATTVGASAYSSYLAPDYFSSEGFSSLGNPFADDESDNDGFLNFDFALTGKFTLGIKQGNAFSLYFFDASDVVGGVSGVSIDSNGVKAAKDVSFAISHAGLWTSEEPPTGGDDNPPVRVPEPSSVLLFALGLLGLAVARKKVA